MRSVLLWLMVLFGGVFPAAIPAPVKPSSARLAARWALSARLAAHSRSGPAD